MSAIETAILALFGAIVTPLVAMYVARRSKSGKIATTDADKLWDAINHFVEDLKAEIARKDEIIKQHEARIQHLEQRCINYDQELTKRNRDYELLRKRFAEAIDHIADEQWKPGWNPMEDSDA